ncbi:MAG: penicillin-binding protein 2 [Deltaproteobacteria bacterium]|nr:penicillin-binding protein 2 [Deltaproteobacteria bacterium]
MTMLSGRREVGEFKKHYKWMALVVFVTFGVLFVRLIYLQLITYSNWSAESHKNITKRIRLPATRGIIRDVNGVEVATNRAAYDVFITPQFLSNDDLSRIAKLMGLSRQEAASLKKRIDQIPAHRRSHMIRFFEDITRDQLASLETHQRDFWGLDVVVVPVRRYPFKSLGAHAIGFLNEVNAEELQSLAKRGYAAGQRVGRSGLERAWESYLRGRDGELAVVVDVRGKEIALSAAARNKRQQTREPIPGRDLRLTLNMEMMRTVERAFRGHPSGAAVLVDVRTGRVRAMFSKPSYDLNEMSGKLSPERSKEIEENPFRPLIDKTTYESYFPGSTFKPFSALAALQDHILDTSTHFDCPGYYELGGRRFRCSDAHGEVDMRKAIIQSCNVYFYHLAEQTGLDRLARIAQDFGLGARTGIGINTEATGFIPTKQWYLKQYGNKFRVGFTLNEALGQGNTRVTLIQLAMAYSAIANGGTLYVPQLVQSVEAPGGVIIEEFQPRVRRRVSIDREHLSYMIDSLFGVVNDKKGTAFDVRIENGVPIAGKTGTAQVSYRRPSPGENPRRAGYYRRSHAWFVGFAPAPNPEYAAAVLVEHGGPGGKYAAPVAIQILQEVLSGELRK